MYVGKYISAGIPFLIVVYVHTQSTSIENLYVQCHLYYTCNYLTSISTSNKTQYKPKLNNNKHRKYKYMYYGERNITLHTEKTTTSIQTLELLCKVSKLCYNTIFRWWHLDRRQKHDNIIIVAKSELKCQHYFDVSSYVYHVTTYTKIQNRIPYMRLFIE